VRRAAKKLAGALSVLPSGLLKGSRRSHLEVSFWCVPLKVVPALLGGWTLHWDTLKGGISVMPVQLLRCPWDLCRLVTGEGHC
jgi:hypothetical protein